jgi:hypothetical protein
MVEQVWLCMFKIFFIWGAAILMTAGASGAAATNVVASSPYELRTAFKTNTEIDRLVSKRWEQLGIERAAVCSDAVFVRRVYLDVIGTLPKAEEAREFLVDKNPGKRADLIEKLLAREEFADYWAMKWGDLLRIKAEFPINLWPNAVQSYHRWVRTSLRENKPYDRFVREMLTASGSNFRSPPVNFYRAVQNRQDKGLAQVVALTFMGERAEKWPADKLNGMAAFFSQVGYKSTEEWKEEIVFFDSFKITNAPVYIFPDGTKTNIPSGVDPREVFADWLIRDSNPWFARNIANRVWAWLMGRGIVQEPDDFRADNPPENPELLRCLTTELIKSHYDLKQLYRLILNSQTYQLSSIPHGTNMNAAAHFACYPVRRLEAEVLIDAINSITSTTEKYTSPIPEPYTIIPENQRSIELADGSTTSTFLELYGRSSRDTGLESERSNRSTPDQRLHLLNSTHIQRKLEQCPKIKALLQSKRTPRQVVASVYLIVLSRFPTESETQIALNYWKSGNTKPREATLDLTWALINSTEFLYRH